MAAEAAQDEPKVEEGGQLVAFTQKFEGVRVVDYRLNFGGNVALGDPKLIEALKLGNEATLVIKVKVVSRGHGTKKGKDGGTVGAISSSNVTVESVALDESTAA